MEKFTILGQLIWGVSAYFEARVVYILIALKRSLAVILIMWSFYAIFSLIHLTFRP